MIVARQDRRQTMISEFEEEKHGDGGSINSSSQPLPEKDGRNSEEEEEESEDQKALIDLYGSRIKVIRWAFENDEILRKQQS